MNIVSNLMVPLTILLILFYGLYKKINLYEAFLKGAKSGLKVCLQIYPAMIAMVFAVTIFFESRVLNFLASPLNRFINIPIEIISMAFLRPISGNASTAIMINIFKKFGVDSFWGILSSVLQGCTDTTVYVIALYYSYVKVKKIRYTLTVGLLADLVGIIMAFILTNIFF